MIWISTEVTFQVRVETDKALAFWKTQLNPNYACQFTKVRNTSFGEKDEKRNEVDNRSGQMTIIHQPIQELSGSYTTIWLGSFCHPQHLLTVMTCQKYIEISWNVIILLFCLLSRNGGMPKNAFFPFHYRPLQPTFKTGNALHKSSIPKSTSPRFGFYPSHATPCASALSCICTVQRWRRLNTGA